jgi:O-antigen/teichoic acid export membrane protein
LIALFVGVVGMGEFALFNSTLNTLNFLVGLGLSYSATKEIAQNHTLGNNYLSKLFKIVTYWLLIPSILGTVCMILFSRYLSSFYFHSYSKSISISLLSISIIFTAYAGRNNMFLQGMGKFKELALSSLLGSVFGLFFSIPLFYYLKIEAVVPSIILSSIVAFFSSKFFFSRSIHILNIYISLKDIYFEGKGMVVLGMVMMAASLLGSLVTNVINLYITNYGTLSDLGLYNAGYNISIQYVALIFSAMTTEFFPRLSSVAFDNNKVSKMVNQQTEIAILILLPILSIMVFSAPLIIKFILSNDFKPVIPFIRVISFSLIFQALAYTISNIPIVKGDKKIFFVFNSFVPGVSAVIFLIFGYRFFGLLGVAFGIVFVNLLHFAIMYIVCYRRYKFVLSKNVLNFSAVTFLILILTNVSVYYLQSLQFYFALVVLILIALFYSIKNLNKLLELNEIWANLLLKFK